MSAGGPPTTVFLDIDVDGHRAAHKRAVDFVSANSIKYGLSSADLRELGGSERARLPELFSSDHAWSARGRIELSPAPAERVVIELFAAAAPTCAANFRALCTASRDSSRRSSRGAHDRSSRGAHE